MAEANQEPVVLLPSHLNAEEIVHIEEINNYIFSIAEVWCPDSMFNI